MAIMEIAVTHQRDRTAIEMTITETITGTTTSNNRLKKAQHQTTILDRTSSQVTSRFTNEDVIVAILLHQVFRILARLKVRPTIKTSTTSNSIIKTCR